MFPGIARLGDSYVNICRSGTGTIPRQVPKSKIPAARQPGFYDANFAQPVIQGWDCAPYQQRLTQRHRQPHGVGTQRRTTHPPP